MSWGGGSLSWSISRAFEPRALCGSMVVLTAGALWLFDFHTRMRVHPSSQLRPPVTVWSDWNVLSCDLLCLPLILHPILGVPNCRLAMSSCSAKAPYKPRTAKHKAAGAKPALPSATLHSPECQSKEQHQPGAADATENSRQRRRARHAPANPAAAAPAASLPPLPPSKPCAEAADPRAAGLREAVALPPGLDASSTKRRVQGSRGVPIEWTSLG